MPLRDISHDQRLKNVGEILIALPLRPIGIGAGHAADAGVLIKVVVDHAPIVIKAVFLKREREDLNFECPPRKKRRQVTRQQERVRPGDEYAVLFRRMEAIDCSFETIAHLHFIDK